MKSPEQIIREHYASLGRKRTKAKLDAVRLNQKHAVAACSAPVESLERAYQAVKAGRVTMTRAAREIAKSRYKRFLRYTARRDDGEPWQCIDLANL